MSLLPATFARETPLVSRLISVPLWYSCAKMPENIARIRIYSISRFLKYCVQAVIEVTETAPKLIPCFARESPMSEIIHGVSFASAGFCMPNTPNTISSTSARFVRTSSRNSFLSK